MNKFMKFFVACFLTLAMMSLTSPQSQEMTEIKISSASHESSGLKIIFAVKPSADEAPMVTKVLELAKFGASDVIKIPRSEQVILGAVSIDTKIESDVALPSNYAEQFQIIALESAKRCNVAVKGNLTDGVNFTISELEW